jgi:hypothetical protein
MLSLKLSSVVWFFLILRCATSSKAKEIPVRAWTGPLVVRRFRVPEFLDNQHITMVRLSAPRTGRFYDTGDTHVIVRVDPLAHSVAWRTTFIKYPNDLTGNRTRNIRLPLCLNQLHHSKSHGSSYTETLQEKVDSEPLTGMTIFSLTNRRFFQRSSSVFICSVMWGCVLFGEWLPALRRIVVYSYSSVKQHKKNRLLPLE